MDINSINKLFERRSLIDLKLWVTCMLEENGAFSRNKSG
ncbi:hypothetical protein bmyco0003_18490 [Bacillus pseudomycoides]|nr:hypothetical protein bmyco0003_18490 [Bacillus pseudomycoides]